MSSLHLGTWKNLKGDFFPLYSTAMFTGFALLLYTVTTESEIRFSVWNLNLPLNVLTSSCQPAKAKVLM